ncbi:hypothetical protein [Pseudolactococcus carnosus]|nr:hypothetical protein [Lactococcus carnosus]
MGMLHQLMISQKILAMFLMVIGVAVMGYVNGVIISAVMGQYKK